VRFPPIADVREPYLHAPPPGQPVQPGPRTTRPGLAPVCLPPAITWTPLTNTSSTPVASCLGFSNVLGQDVAPLRNTSVTGPDGPLPVSGMSSKTDTNPIVASAARPKKATALPYWSVV